jgi:hypothetical protein
MVLAARAGGTTAVATLNAANAARIRVFTGLLQLWSGGMSGFDATVIDLCRVNDNLRLPHWIYALIDEIRFWLADDDGRARTDHRLAGALPFVLMVSCAGSVPAIVPPRAH